MKIQIAKAILVDSSSHSSRDTDVLSLIDRNKVKDIPLIAFNHIIYNDCFTDAERAFIREERRKCVNRRAANVSRRRRKEEEQWDQIEVNQMLVEKDGLLEMKDNLKKEIERYKKLNEERLSNDCLFDEAYDLSIFDSLFDYTYADNNNNNN